MKTIITTVALLVSVFMTTAQTEAEVTTDGTTITVKVPMKTDKGMVYGALHTEKSFMRAQGVEASSSIENGIATLTYTNVAPGTYGITIFHDANDNKKMDFEANGMPKEMYGVSNNVMNFGPPMWSDAKFEVANEAIEMEIRM